MFPWTLLIVSHVTIACHSMVNQLNIAVSVTVVLARLGIIATSVNDVILKITLMTVKERISMKTNQIVITRQTHRRKIRLTELRFLLQHGSEL